MAHLSTALLRHLFIPSEDNGNFCILWIRNTNRYTHVQRHKQQYHHIHIQCTAESSHRYTISIIHHTYRRQSLPLLIFFFFFFSLFFLLCSLLTIKYYSKASIFFLTITIFIHKRDNIYIQTYIHSHIHKRIL